MGEILNILCRGGFLSKVDRYNSDNPDTGLSEAVIVAIPRILLWAAIWATVISAIMYGGGSDLCALEAANYSAIVAASSFLLSLIANLKPALRTANDPSYKGRAPDDKGFGRWITECEITLIWGLGFPFACGRGACREYHSVKNDGHDSDPDD